MNSPAHVAFALALARIFPLDLTFIALGSVAPDLDFALQHRISLHTLLFPLIFFLAARLLKKDWLNGFAVGMLSHIFLDSFTVTGVAFLYPYKSIMYSVNLPDMDFPVIALSLLVILSVKIQQFLKGLAATKARKFIALFLVVYFLLLIPSVYELKVPELLLQKAKLEGKQVSVEGTVVDKLDNYVSKQGNVYQQFYLEQEGSRILIFSSDITPVAIGEKVIIKGKFTTEYKEPEISTVGIVR